MPLRDFLTITENLALLPQSLGPLPPETGYSSRILWLLSPQVCFSQALFVAVDSGSHSDTGTSVSGGSCNICVIAMRECGKMSIWHFQLLY